MRVNIFALGRHMRVGLSLARSSLWGVMAVAAWGEGQVRSNSNKSIAHSVARPQGIVACSHTITTTTSMLLSQYLLTTTQLLSMQ